MMKSMLRESTVWLLILLGGIWGLTQIAGCNTVEGVGEDVEAVGEGIEDAAD